MSNQPAPTRPWFRLASIVRPAPQAPSPTPEPAPVPPRPAATVRPAFRPAVQAQPPTTAAPPPLAGVSSVPTSPLAVGRASQPSSPSDKKPTISTTVPVSAIASAAPRSPVKTVPTATAAGPTSSPPKTATTVSVPSSPAKPVATTTSVPTSPAKTAPTITSLTSSPTQKPAAPATTTARVPSPKASITTVKPARQFPIRSPKIKPLTAPTPSPLTLSPSQLKAQADLDIIPVEAEQKTALVQKTIDKPKEWLFGAPQHNLGDILKPSIPLNEPYNNGETKEQGHGKKLSSDSEDASMRVITIAGENKGAFMELIRSPHKNGFQGSSHCLQKVNSSRTRSDSISDYHSYSSGNEEAGDRKMKDKSNTPKTMPMNAFMNSNVQGFNNSIVYNSSWTHHDPGVQLSLHRKPTAGGIHIKERINGYNS